jgi:hypothetical protein
LSQEEERTLELSLLGSIPDALKGLVRDRILIVLGKKEPPKMTAGNVWNKITAFYDSF